MSFYKDGKKWSVCGTLGVDIHEQIPPGYYVLCIHPKTGLYLEEVDDFSMPQKVYGDLPAKADRILNTFLDRPNTTGVLLSGEKGGGKTLLAKMISQMGKKKHNLPTILVNIPIGGDDFSKLLQSIHQPKIVLMDEFEKTYSRKNGDQNCDPDDEDSPQLVDMGGAQKAILTLLDGVYSNKTLFVLTCNNKYGVDKHMHNRPGRIYYSIDFKGMEKDAIEEYCLDNLKNKTHADKIMKVASMFEAFNFDILKAIIEESNRYDEDPVTAMKMLNALPFLESYTIFDVDIKVGDKQIKEDKVYTRSIKGNPLSQKGLCAGYYTSNHTPHSLELTQAHLVDVDHDNGRYVYKIGGTTVTYTREKFKNVSWTV